MLKKQRTDDKVITHSECVLITPIYNRPPRPVMSWIRGPRKYKLPIFHLPYIIRINKVWFIFFPFSIFCLKKEHSHLEFMSHENVLLVYRCW